jgi:flagellin
MSLRINHNITALDAWRNLTHTTSYMTKSMEKLSSGYRINRAADDPAGLVISEQFRAQIAGLNKAISNAEGSINMIQTAEGALTEINSLLVNMRELAIHAANEGFNDENQLLADQAEITNAIRTINRIAANTQFGTKLLLDGSVSNSASFTTANNSLLTVKDSTLSAGAHTISATKVSDESASFDNTSLGITNPTSPYSLTDGTHNVDVVQASAGATKTGTALEIQDAWGNYLVLAAAATSAALTATFAAASSNALKGTITMVIDYQESVDGPVGQQFLEFSFGTIAGGATATVVANAFKTAFDAALAANATLSTKLESATGAGAANHAFTVRTVGTGSQFSFNVSEMSSTQVDLYSFTGADLVDSARGASAQDTLQMDLNVAATGGLFRTQVAATLALAAGTYDTAATLLAQINTQLATCAGTVGDGNGVTSIQATLVTEGGQTKLRIFTMDEGSKFWFKFADSSTGTGRSGLALGISNDNSNVTGTDALVSLDGYVNTISDIRYHENAGDLQTATLYDSSSSGTRGSVTVQVEKASGVAGGINIGNIVMTVNARTFSVSLDAGAAVTVTAGEWGTIFDPTGEESIKVKYALTSDGGSEQVNVTDESLVFQIGANVGQTARIAIQNMNAAYLGQNMTGNQFSSLAEIEVTTAEKAADAQEIIDAAIDEVTNTRGNLGSFQKNTLESTLSNLRIASQNLTAAESSMRDTDMAKEMSTFVRHQILLQAGTAMLAQANQIPQVVLSLFR